MSGDLETMPVGVMAGLSAARSTRAATPSTSRSSSRRRPGPRAHRARRLEAANDFYRRVAEDDVEREQRERRREQRRVRRDDGERARKGSVGGDARPRAPVQYAIGDDNPASRCRAAWPDPRAGLGARGHGRAEPINDEGGPNQPRERGVGTRGGNEPADIHDASRALSGQYSKPPEARRGRRQ